MVVHRAEKAYEKHAWILLFVTSVLLIPTAVFLFIEERTFLGGIGMLGLATFGMVIAGISYRKGERWAWYTLWYLTGSSASGEAVDVVFGGTTHGLFFLAILSLLGLLLPYRKFFPRK